MFISNLLGNDLQDNNLPDNDFLDNNLSDFDSPLRNGGAIAIVVELHTHAR